MEIRSQKHTDKESAVQYHHYIPRFILRNFAHPFQPPSNPDKSTKRSKRKWKKGYYPGDPMLYIINLAGPVAELAEEPVSRVFGMTDMYRDFSISGNQYNLEQQLSRLESRAADIIGRIRKQHQEKKADIWLSRSDRDALRKFLFIMKYRSSEAHRRFSHNAADHYTEDDKERLLKYMNEKGYQKPIDVWYDNIKALLDIKMDTERKWMANLEDRMYPDDAKWAIAHMQMMYLALCTPSSQEDEFLMTENGYGIHEGPTSVLSDGKGSEALETRYTEYHVFAVVSPQLIMVLRSFLLPNAEEDLEEGVREWRENLYRLNAEQHIFPFDANSILADLPITKARNSYTTIINGRQALAPGEDGSARTCHRFCFPFFPISTYHVNKINCIMLEQSCSISTIAFKTPSIARKSFEYYLSMPCQVSDFRSFKVITGDLNNQRLLFLKKMECILKQMGSNITAVYQVSNSTSIDDNLSEIFGRIIQKNLPNESSGILELYMKLGKSSAVVYLRPELTLYRWKCPYDTEGYGSSKEDAQHENQG